MLGRLPKVFVHQKQHLLCHDAFSKAVVTPPVAKHQLFPNSQWTTPPTISWKTNSPVPTFLSGSTAYTVSDSSMTEYDTACVQRDALTLKVPSPFVCPELDSVPSQELCLASMGSRFIDTEKNEKVEATAYNLAELRLTRDEHTRPPGYSKSWPAEPSDQTNLDKLNPKPSAKSLGSSGCTDSLLSDSEPEDPIWLNDLYNVCGILGAKHPFFFVESEAIQDVVRTYQGQPLSGSESTGSSKPPSTRTGGVGVDTGKVAGKRPFEADEPAAGDEEGPTIKSRRKQVCPGEARLSCPFQKRDPERYPLCGIRHGGYLTIAHVKQHLRRSHKRNPNYCPRCKTTFSTEAQKNEHIMQAFLVPCQELVTALPEGISPEMEEALTRRVELGSNLHDQWFSVWDMIFPGIPRPASCTFDLSSETHIQVLGLVSYLESEGPAIVQSTLGRNGLLVWSANPEHMESAPADVEFYTRGVLSQAFRQLYESWQAQRPQPSSATSSGHLISTPLTGCSLQEGQNLPPTPISSSSHGEHVGHNQIPVGLSAEELSNAASRMADKIGQGNGFQELPSLPDSDEAMMWLAYEDSNTWKSV